MNEQLIKIAKAHGHKADHSLSGGVDVWIAYTQGRISGFEKFTVHNLRQLKIVLGY
jgi:hypothetical protein